MASRSFKPASFLASAPTRSPRRSPRPSFTRTSSTSSTASEDSLLTTLRSMKLEKSENIITSPSRGSGRETPKNKSSTSLSRQHRDETPSRKKSAPIAIELPHKEQVYTPLSARGDLPGGYFPLHEDFQRIYRPHPFHERSKMVESPIMSAAASPMSSPASDSTPRGPAGLASPSIDIVSIPPSIPEPLLRPVGKYHPANYQSPATTRVSTPTSAPRLLPPLSMNLAGPGSAAKNERPRHGHERKNSDVRRKLQQYQRDMIAQAKGAASSARDVAPVVAKEPNSPKLQPAGSPGPITPFELEELDGEGYIAAGHRVRVNTGSSNEL